MCLHGLVALAHSFVAKIANCEGSAGPEPLFDGYSLGQELGRGSFGIVYSGNLKGSHLRCAVKRVSKLKCGEASISQEVDMLHKFAHPSVVKLYSVYADTYTVDMVFSYCCGGDLFEALHLNWVLKGGVSMDAIQSLSCQMFAGIEWLHQNNVVHRDVKAENYLLDHVDLAHPECCICLSDFGCAVELEPGERLKDRRGTKVYWAPEVYAQSYALKVDVWAAGVTVYSMLAGFLPFDMEGEVVANSRTEVPSMCGEAAQSFVLGVLERSEDKRPTASEALEHPFLTHAASAAPATRLPSSGKGGSSIYDQGVEALQPSASCKFGATTTTMTTTASSISEAEHQVQESVSAEECDVDSVNVMHGTTLRAELGNRWQVRAKPPSKPRTV